jgi:putative nucleotidyltransferase with HDIG domain
MGDVAEVVSSDPGVSAQILHVANSAFFAAAAKSDSVEHAVNRLGTETVRSLVLAAEVFGSENRPEGVTDTWLLAQRDHAIAAAMLARQIVPDRARRDQAFLAGLLHDIGELITPSRAAAAGATPAGVPDGSHAELGAYLLGLWGLPDPIVEAVALHHRPAAAEPSPGLDVLVATHVTEALLAELAPPDPSTDVVESLLDEPWLQSVGHADKLDDWRALAQAVARGET